MEPEVSSNEARLSKHANKVDNHAEVQLQGPLNVPQGVHLAQHARVKMHRAQAV